MTFKAIVKFMVGKEATEAIENLLKENGIEYKFALTEGVEFEKEYNIHFLWTVGVKIHFERHSCTYKIGGTVDDLLGICVSCVWNNDELVWLFNPESRKAMGFERFAA